MKVALQKLSWIFVRNSCPLRRGSRPRAEYGQPQTVTRAARLAQAMLATDALQAKTVTLMSSDLQPYEVSEEVAFMSETVKNTLEGRCQPSTSCHLRHGAFVLSLYNLHCEGPKAATGFCSASHR